MISSIQRIINIIKKAEGLLLGITELLSDGGITFIKETILSQAIPAPELFINQKPSDKGISATRLVVPDTNFTSAFPKIEYISIKKLLDSGNLNSQSKTTIQVSGLKESLEEMDLLEIECTIISLDVKSVYPSIKYNLEKL